MIRLLEDLLSSFQFLTRLPLPSFRAMPDSVSRAAKFFPVVGLVIGLGAAALHRILVGITGQHLTALSVLSYLVLVTGGLHEDGLADAADGFGGGWSKDKILLIMRDSRIGVFGTIALVLSLLARYTLLTDLAPSQFSSYVVIAHVLCRWTTLPLGTFLRAAREGEGQGAQVAQRISRFTLVFGTVVSLAICFLLLREHMWLPVAVATTITILTGIYYRSQIGGVTGDCFGATNQLTEIAIYVCGGLKP
jgi:adenosylcobinamide-GDP ribazoletransferase